MRIGNYIYEKYAGTAAAGTKSDPHRPHPIRVRSKSVPGLLAIPTRLEVSLWTHSWYTSVLVSRGIPPLQRLHTYLPLSVILMAATLERPNGAHLPPDRCSCPSPLRTQSLPYMMMCAFQPPTRLTTLPQVYAKSRTGLTLPRPDEECSIVQ